MTILITLTTVGIDCSTFDIYSDVDGFISAFETDVPKASLSAGFSSANVPENTTIIRIKSKGLCSNYIDINLSSITTTTTSTTIPPISPTAKVSQDALGNILDDIHSDSTTWSLYGTSFTAYNGATILSANWQIMNISTTSGWIDQGVATEDIEKIWVLNEFNYGFRIKVVDSNGLEGYSNELRKYYSGLPTQSYWYQGRWGAADEIENPEMNCWVKYLNEFGLEDIFTIGPKENGCQEIVASSIIQTNGVNPCIPE